LLRPKKVVSQPVVGSDKIKRTNEIGIAIPLLASKDVTTDALLTQRALAEHIGAHQGHDNYTVKGNQASLERDIALLVEQRGPAHFVQISPPVHGRIETRRIWCSTALNGYLDFPHVGQIFLVERKTRHKGSGKSSREIALGMVSRPPQQASPQRLLAINRGHWVIESVHHLMDWNCDEDRSRIGTGNGTQNITRLRHFVIGLLKSIQTPSQTIAALTRDQAFRTRRVFDLLRLTRNSAPGRA
jgi:predicted transposase YbfD/YdcC